MREFNRLLAKGQSQKQNRRAVTSGVWGDMKPVLVRLKNVETIQTNYAGRGKDSAVRPVDADEFEALRRALGIVKQLLEKQCGHFKPRQGGTMDNESIYSNEMSRK